MQEAHANECGFHFRQLINPCSAQESPGRGMAALEWKTSKKILDYTAPMGWSKAADCAPLTAVNPPNG